MYFAVWKAAFHGVPRTWSWMKSLEDVFTQKTVRMFCLLKKKCIYFSASSMLPAALTVSTRCVPSAHSHALSIRDPVQQNYPNTNSHDNNR